MPELTATPSMTAADLLRMGSNGTSYELIGGRLRELKGSIGSSWVAGQILGHLMDHVRQTGWVFGPGCGYQCFADEPERVLRPDVSYVSLERFPVARFQQECRGFVRVVPDIAVEVVAPDDLATDVYRRWMHWREAGAALVWVVYPDTPSLHIFRANGTCAVLSDDDTLTAPDVLPGFAVPVAELFRLPPAPATT